MRSTKRRRRALSTASKSRFHISSPLSTLCKNNLIWLPDLYMRSVFYPIFPFFLSSLLSILLLHFLSLAFPYDVCTTNKQTNKHIGVPFYYHRLWLIYNVLCFIHTYPSYLFHVPDLLRHPNRFYISLLVSFFLFLLFIKPDHLPCCTNGDRERYGVGN
jgi:hypothetical protein